MLKTTLNAPWFDYYKKVNAMFEQDHEVRVVFNHEAYEILVYVESQAKAEVLDLMLKHEVVFGSITLTIEVVPPNKSLKAPRSPYEEAFSGNYVVSRIEQLDGAFKATYIVFERRVVQYFTDDMSSLYGVHSTLYETIAKEIFVAEPGVYFCTEQFERLPYFEHIKEEEA